MELRIAGKTDQSVYVYIVQDVGGTSPGEPKTGLTHSNIDSIYYTREGATAVTIGTLSTLAAANSAHTDGGFKEVDATNCPGQYRVDLPDAAFAAGVASIVLHVRVAAASNAVAAPCKIGLIAVDLRDTVRAGITALPNAAADAAGGLPISDLGGLDLDTLLSRLDAAITSRLASSSYVAQSGDSYPIVSSGTFGNAALKTLIDTLDTVADAIKVVTDNLPNSGALSDLATLASRLTAARAGYLDNLNVGGAVASSAEATSIQNNTRCVRVVPSVIERPDSGSTTYRVELFLYDDAGNMEAPDSAPTLALVDQDGNDLSSRLDASAGTLVSTGRYRWVYTATSTDDLEQLVWAFSVVEGGNTRVYGNNSVIVDTTAVDFTAADRTKLDTLHDTRLTAARAGYLDSLNGHTPQSGDSYPIVSSGTFGNSALKTLIDTVDTVVDAIKLVTDQLPDSGALTSLAQAGKLLKYVRLLARSDAAPTTDDAAELAEINANSGSGAGAYDQTAHSVQALRVRGDAAWTTGGGGSIADLLNVQVLVPPALDLADTATWRLGLMLFNALDDLPTTAEITPGTISIDRKAAGDTSWNSVVNDAAMSEAAGLVYYDEVFDAATGYAAGDSLRITFKNQKVTVASNDYEVTDGTGRIFYSTLRESMRGTDGANTTTPPTAAAIRAEIDANSAGLAAIYAAIGTLENLSQAEAQAACDAALVALHLDHLLAAAYDPASKPGSASGLLNALVENDGGVPRYTVNALEQAPAGGGGGSGATMATAVPDTPTDGTMGHALRATLNFVKGNKEVVNVSGQWKLRIYEWDDAATVWAEFNVDHPGNPSSVVAV